MADNYFISRRDLSRKRYSVSQKFQSEDLTVSRLQYEQERFVNQNSAGDMSQSNKIEDIAVTPSGVNVSHKLGKVYSGFNVIKNDSNANIYVDEDSNPDKKLFIRLKSSANCTISIMVF